jgi:hypothetical protein
LSLSLQHLSRGSEDTHVLQAELTGVREAATATEAARIMTMLAVETSTQEAAAMGDSAVVHVKDLEDWAALVERVARKWV